MGVNWNSWVEMFAGSAQWGDRFQRLRLPTFFPSFVLAFKTSVMGLSGSALASGAYYRR